MIPNNNWRIKAEDGTECIISSDQVKAFCNWMESKDPGPRSFGDCEITKIPQRYLLIDPQGTTRKIFYPPLLEKFICPLCGELVSVPNETTFYVHASCRKEGNDKTVYNVDWQKKKLVPKDAGGNNLYTRTN
ncbi:MAG: hypothetical protein M1596_05395 [Firmicutes bacterium]|nr:hypothetical protein [Bacillota bacterium]